VLNSNEIARNKFKALFAAHDSKNLRVTTEQQKPALKAFKKAATKNAKPQ
jgi:hypothetical protein